MPTRIHRLEDTGLLEQLEPTAFALRSGSSESELLAAQLELQSVLEFALCEIMAHGTFTKRLWCDGVEFLSIEPAPNNIRCSGSAWCADVTQWRVPTYAKLSFSQPRSTSLATLELGLGDAEMTNLADHQRSKARAPLDWLEVFRVHRAPLDPQLDALAVISQLKQFLAVSRGARIVGPDWRYISLDSATLFIEHQTAAGLRVALEETWLDHSPAVRLAQAKRK